MLMMEMVYMSFEMRNDMMKVLGWDWVIWEIRYISMVVVRL